MQNKSFFLIFWSAVGLFISSCVVTSPVSETMMFQEEPEPSKKEELIFPGQFTKPPRHSAKPNPTNVFSGLKFSARPRIKNELDYAKTKFADFVEKKNKEPDIEDSDYQIANSYNSSFSVPISLIETSSFALGMNIGVPVLGMDLTAKIFDDVFVTANLHYLSGEVIVNKKVFQNQKLGVAVGSYFRLQHRWLQVIEGPDESFGLSTIFSGLSPARTFYNKTLGIRTTLFVPFIKDTYLHAVVAPGYVSNLKRFTVNVGVSLRYDL